MQEPKKETVEQMQKRHRREMKANRDKIQERKARTRRLIIRGAIAEAMVTGAEMMTDEEFKRNLELRIKQAPGRDPR